MSEQVSVLCDEHEKPWLVDEFTRFDGNWIGAQSMPGQWERGGPFGKALRRSSADAFGFVDASGQWDRDEGGEPGWPNRRYNLKCRLCARTVPARHENLVPILDVLAANGVPSISLAALAARLHVGERR